MYVLAFVMFHWEFLTSLMSWAGFCWRTLIRTLHWTRTQIAIFRSHHSQTLYSWYYGKGFLDQKFWIQGGLDVTPLILEINQWLWLWLMAKLNLWVNISTWLWSKLLYILRLLCCPAISASWCWAQGARILRGSSFWTIHYPWGNPTNS